MVSKRLGIRLTKKGAVKIERIVVDDVVMMDDKSKPVALNTQVGNKIAGKISNPGNLNKYRTLRSNLSSIFFEPAREDEILRILTNLDPDKSPGFDGIPALSLKGVLRLFHRS